MYEFIDDKGTARSIPIEKVALSFTDPDDGKPVVVPVTQLVIGGLDCDTINKYPFVYDRNNGYISIRGETDIFMRKLDPRQIRLIEDVLKIKEKAKGIVETIAPAEATGENNNFSMRK